MQTDEHRLSAQTIWPWLSQVWIAGALAGLLASNFLPERPRSTTNLLLLGLASLVALASALRVLNHHLATLGRLRDAEIGHAAETFGREMARREQDSGHA